MGNSDIKCPKCNSINFIFLPSFSGVYSGGVVCNDCGYRDTFLTYIGKQICKIEPMPVSSLHIYENIKN